MCLAIPMEIKSMDGDQRGVAATEGIEREIGLMLIEDPRVGDYVIVHAGFAIEKLDQEEARARLDLFDQLAEAMGQ